MNKPKNDSDRKDLSIIIPVYYNEDTIKITYDTIYDTVIAKNKDLSCEVIIVDDGSRDNSLNEILNIKKENKDIIKVIKFSRNFGQVNAILAGYIHAKGKIIINLSADMQDPAELMNEMIKFYYDEGYQIVICTRHDREESLFRQVTSNIFYFIMKKLSFPNIPMGGFDYVLISDKIRDILIKNQEANPFWQGQILWTGYKIKLIPYVRKKREAGESKWTFSKKIKYLIDGVLGYSYFPLRVMSLLGIIVAITGFGYAAFIFLFRIFGKIPVKGWAPLMIVILILSGLQMLMTGVVGEYLWRILDQVRNRQPFIIEQIID